MFKKAMDQKASIEKGDSIIGDDTEPMELNNKSMMVIPPS
jgi:hypothetical protein